MQKRRIKFSSVVIVTAVLISTVFLSCCIRNIESGRLSFAEDTVMYYARQKTQIYHGEYDESSDSTFIVYSAGIKNGLSACSPYIISYDHSSSAWSAPVKIADAPVEPDSHYYPQLVTDDQGYLHVFHSFHNNHDILYAKSQIPGDISSWDISYLENTETSTYGAAFSAANGDIYLLFRCRDGSNPDYEPEYFMKSTDTGLYWSKQILIDPAPVTDHWGTIYTKSVHYEETPQEGLHIVFAVHQYHNSYFNEHYYIFFNFEDDNIYSADGNNLGPALESAEFSECLLFEYDESKPFFNTRTAVALDADHSPVVFFNKEVGGDQHLLYAKWDSAGAEWDISDTGLPYVYPFEAERNAASDFYVYAVKGNSSINRYRILGGEYVFVDYIDTLPDRSNRRFSHLGFIKNYHDDLKGMYMEGLPSDWDEPNPGGRLIHFDSGLSQ